MNNKIQLKFNYALVLSFATAVYGHKFYRKTISPLLIKYEYNYPFFFNRQAAFVPIIVLKKNHYNPLNQNLKAASCV